MREAANQHWFDRPDALLTARGAQAGKPIQKADGTLDWETDGGIESPAPRRLPAYTRLVRFSGSSDRIDRDTGQHYLGGSPIPWLAAAGGWWLEWPQYKIVEAYADRAKTSISAAIGHLCCVPAEWNDATVVLQATLKLPLMAYAGLGAAANGRDGTIRGENPHGSRVEQLYIPGMGSSDLRHDALMIDGSGFVPCGTRR